MSDFNKDLFSSMTFIDWTYSYEFVTMVGSSGKYGEYNSFNLDILSVMDLFKIIIYLFAFSRREIIFASSSMLLHSRVDINFVISSFYSIFYAFYLNIFFNLYISIYMLVYK